MATRLLVTALPGARGRTAVAAAIGVALAAAPPDAGDGFDGAVLLVEVGDGRSRGPTILAAAAARELEGRLRAAGHACAARGRLAWLRIPAEPDWEPALVEAIALGAAAVAMRADLPGQRALAALAVMELRAAGIRVLVTRHEPGRVATRRALAGIDPGGESSRRSARLVERLVGRRAPARRPEGLIADSARPRPAEAGQALPLVLGGVLLLVVATLILAAFGGAVTGKSRAQRAADLVALSAARSMRDDFDRLFVPARRPDGSANPAHLGKADYLDRAAAAAAEAADRNGVARGRLHIEFPDRDSFAPLRVRAEVGAELDASGALPPVPVDAHAEAEAVPAAAPASTPAPSTATGGGYSGPLVYRQGEGMRPDVAAAFDRMAAAAAADGISLLVNDGFRSDAEQAVLWAENPDPRWVAPPGTSLHRCATELDLGPTSAYGWLAANAGRFGFVQRYSWEAWHYGYAEGPAPCSAAGDAAGAEPDGGGAEASLPAFVPARFRSAIATAAARWNVSASLLAGQLMAESNFNPFAVSPAGAAGIAQFMPGTAAMYGLDDPFDAERAIDAQAHLMADLLGQFGDPSLALAAYNAGPAPVAECGCVPAIPETQAYVARILGLIHGAVASTLTPTTPSLEVRLVD
jgi:hypothetical protein